MVRDLRCGGFSLIEALVATGVLAMVVLAVTANLIAAQRARAGSERRMLASQYAADGVERLRAGHPLGTLDGAAGFDRSGVVAPWVGHPGLMRVDVTVGWNDGEPRRLTLSTVVRR